MPETRDIRYITIDGQLMCKSCGCAVVDHKVHNKWHKEIGK